MDPFKFTTIAHSGRAICNPISASSVKAMLVALKCARGARVLDVGCGKGEMLIQLSELFEIEGVGVDMNPHFLESAREQARARVSQGAATFVQSPIAEYAVQPSSFDVLICVGSTHAFGELRDALRAASRVLRPRGLALVGEGFWRRDPEPGYLALLDATAQTFCDHAGNIAAGADEGFVIEQARVSSDAEWDDYEGAYARGIADYVAAHPDDPDGPAMLARSTSWHDGYQRWGRTTLGFGMYLFRRG